MNQYLGYTLIDPTTGSEGFGGYDDYAICKGDTPEEVVEDWCKQVGREFNKNNLRIGSDGKFGYHDYFDSYFMQLPGRDVYLPSQIMIRFKKY